MKSILFVTTLMASAVCLASPKPLVETTSGGGPAAYQRTVTINDDGTVVETMGAGLAQGGPTTLTLATLSPDALSRLSYWTSNVDLTKPLVDPNPNGPECMNTFTSSVSMFKDGSPVVISSSGGCHTSSIVGSSPVTSILQTFSDLAK
jgi:hypothetical protein